MICSIALQPVRCFRCRAFSHKHDNTACEKLGREEARDDAWETMRYDGSDTGDRYLANDAGFDETWEMILVNKEQRRCGEPTYSPDNPRPSDF